MEMILKRVASHRSISISKYDLYSLLIIFLCTQSKKIMSGRHEKGKIHTARKQIKHYFMSFIHAMLLKSRKDYL